MMQPAEGHFFAVVNGAAGGGRCRSRFDHFHERLLAAGLDLELHLTEGPRHAIELVRDAYEAGERSFLVVGGDGTSYEAINGLFAGGPDPEGVVLGMLPLGTGNSFLRDFDITNEEAALEAILRGRRRKIDVVRCEHAEGVLHYANILSIGFTAHAGALTNERFKPLGPAGYVAAALIGVARLRYPVDPIRLDDGPTDARPAAFLSFSNSKFTGGAMMMAPSADPTDGKLDVVRAGRLSRGAFIATLPKVFSGTHVERADVEETQARRVDFVEPREQDVMVDGEIARLTIHSLEVRPSALEILV